MTVVLLKIRNLKIQISIANYWKIIFVNDGSQDDSKLILDGLEGQSNAYIIYHKVNRGYCGALKSGIKQVTTPYLVTIDGDGQHNLDDVEKVF